MGKVSFPVTSHLYQPQRLHLAELSLQLPGPSFLALGGGSGGEISAPPSQEFHPNMELSLSEVTG